MTIAGKNHIMILGCSDILISCNLVHYIVSFRGDIMSILTIKRDISKKVSRDISIREQRNSIVIEGIVDSWDKVIMAGKIAANRGYKGVANKLEVKGLKIPDIKKPSIKDSSLNLKKVDVLIIGGGIIGCSIARELSKWNLSILLVDKEDDIAMHASSRNDGMIHPGIEPSPGTKKAYYNVLGNELYKRISKELDVPIKRGGSTILYDKSWLKLIKPYIKMRAQKNDVKGVTFISKEEAKKYEPYITDEIAGALHFDTTGVTVPYKMTLAYAENAVLNGAEVSLNTVVLSIEREGDRIASVTTNRGRVFPKVVINAAGVFADKIADMADDQFFTIHPRKGQIAFLDKKKGYLVNSVISKPDLTNLKKNTKGGGIVKTYEGNILVGPDAYEQPYREDFSTDGNRIDSILNRHLKTINGLNKGDIITYCSGIRASTYEEDFIIERSEYVKNLVYAAGIQSPGFASAPAIALEIERITLSIMSELKIVKPNPTWNPMRKGIPDLGSMTAEERNRFIKNRPDYGIIVCRCEGISKGEVIDSINSPIPASSIDGVKRRVRAGMGRCQGGFCMPLVMEILRDEAGVDMLDITKKGKESYIVAGETKKRG